MELNKTNSNTVDQCRFCWMCRHICPIGNATGQERNTARARALSLSLVKRGAAKLEGDIVDNLYECALCRGCSNDCATGFDPTAFTKEARLSAALEGNMPSYVAKLIENINSTGNIYGEKQVSSVLLDEIRDLDPSAKTLFFIGKDGAYRTPETASEAVKLLKRAGISFKVHKYEPNSGYDIDFLIGAAKETKDVMQKCADEIKAQNVDTVVCYDPADAKVFLHEYKEYGIELGCKVVTFPVFVLSLIKDGKLSPKKADKEYTVQDSAILARDLDDTDSVRGVLSACGKLKEMLLYGKATMLAGNLIMNEYIPGVMALVAEDRIQNALHVGATNLVTSSPAEYRLLKDNAKGRIEILSLEEAVAKCL